MRIGELNLLVLRDTTAYLGCNLGIKMFGIVRSPKLWLERCLLLMYACKVNRFEPWMSLVEKV